MKKSLLFAVVALSLYPIPSKVEPPPQGPVSLSDTEPLCAGFCCSLAIQWPTAPRPWIRTSSLLRGGMHSTGRPTNSQAATSQADRETRAKVYPRRDWDALVMHRFLLLKRSMTYHFITPRYKSVSAGGSGQKKTTFPNTIGKFPPVFVLKQIMVIHLSHSALRFQYIQMSQSEWTFVRIK